MDLPTFFSALENALENNFFVKATLANPRDKKNVLKNVFIKPVQIKEELKYSFVYRNATNDITKNFSAPECIQQIQQLLADHFLNIDVFTSITDYHVLQKKSGQTKVIKKNASQNNVNISLEHDKQKQRIIGQTNKSYLQALGIMNENGDVKKDMQHKYKQINRYVEIVSDVLKDAHIKHDLCIADMGSGKGYLTFALADYLAMHQHNAKMIGVEMRQDMVDLCNTIATESKFANLQFIQGTIQETTVQNMNVLIALHACDTATDDAIKKGIAADANIIICAPCCHKQIRKAMKPNATLHPIVKHGILLERQAEIITDSLRALWLESKGYKTKVFDFVDVHDTPKNVMIVAVKTKRSEAELAEYLVQFTALKKLFGVEWAAVCN
jgi:phosphopantetheinyl transferase (holo-ACP synthase)